MRSVCIPDRDLAPWAQTMFGFHGKAFFFNRYAYPDPIASRDWRLLPVDNKLAYTAVRCGAGRRAVACGAVGQSRHEAYYKRTF
jgi:hypothetical protein